MIKKNIFTTLIGLLIFYSCTDKPLKINHKELTIDEFDRIRSYYFHKIKNERMNDSIDLVIALKICNTINYQKERLLTTENVGYLMIFNQKYLLKVMKKFNFTTKHSDTSLYSKQLNMRILPSKLTKVNDMYILKD